VQLIILRWKENENRPYTIWHDICPKMK